MQATVRPHVRLRTLYTFWILDIDRCNVCPPTIKYRWAVIRAALRRAAAPLAADGARTNLRRPRVTPRAGRADSGARVDKYSFKPGIYKKKT
ncbi:hypothetical protein EVAR_17995_1 [Eumeta japonica]|uniref:Uncharacterized protein n=1 Tax=Eumeta variegata TaxID=151549 RepID=A0A4C1Y8M3_EUMVA|nr:hypothetical protein EVAR_17995_1 [Eumeta japonica]